MHRRGVKLVISDSLEGIKVAISRVFSATWQRCRVHFARNALAHAGKNGRRVVSAFIATAFAQENAEDAKVQWRQVADRLRPSWWQQCGRYMSLKSVAQVSDSAIVTLPVAVPA